jgi:hypothetical protein
MSPLHSTVSGLPLHRCRRILGNISKIQNLLNGFADIHIPSAIVRPSSSISKVSFWDDDCVPVPVRVGAGVGLEMTWSWLNSDGSGSSKAPKDCRCFCEWICVAGFWDDEYLLGRVGVSMSSSRLNLVDCAFLGALNTGWNSCERFGGVWGCWVAFYVIRWGLWTVNRVRTHCRHLQPIECLPQLEDNF